MKAVVLYIIFSKSENEVEKLFKEKESIEIIKMYNYFKKHNPGIWFKNIDETRNYFVDQIERNELMSNKYKKVLQP